METKKTGQLSPKATLERPCSPIERRDRVSILARLASKDAIVALEALDAIAQYALGLIDASEDGVLSRETLKQQLTEHFVMSEYQAGDAITGIVSHHLIEHNAVTGRVFRPQPSTAVDTQ